MRFWGWLRRDDELRMERERSEHLLSEVKRCERDIIAISETLRLSQDDLRDWVSRTQAAETREMRLLNELLALKREGFTAPAPNPAIQQPDTELPVEVRSAIDERATRGTPLHGELTRKATAKLASGGDPSVIASGILLGSTYNPFI